MAKYVVELWRDIRQYAEVQVEAKDETEAAELAEDDVRDDDWEWDCVVDEGVTRTVRDEED